MQPTAGAAFYIGIVAFRVAAIMPIVGCLGLWLDLHDFLALYVNRRWCRRYRNHRGIADRRVTVSHPSHPVSVSISGRIIRSAAAVIAQTKPAQQSQP